MIRSRSHGEGSDVVVLVSWQASFQHDRLAQELGTSCRVLQVHTDDLNYGHVNLEPKLEALRGLLAGARRALFYGCSRGGYSAILWAARTADARQTTFVAVCPQSHYRDASLIRRITHILPEAYGGDLRHERLTSGVVLLSDHPVDEEHARELRRPGLEFRTYPFDIFRGHPRVHSAHHLGAWLEWRPETAALILERLRALHHSSSSQPTRTT